MDVTRDDAASTASFEEFVHAVGPRLYRTALLLCGDHHLAEDLVQVTLGKVFASWRKVRRADSPLAYSRTVLTRTWISHTRLRRSTERPVDVQPGRDGDPAHDAGDPERRLDLLEALGRLSTADRTVLVLRFYDDLSVAQTARLLDLSEAAVRKRVERALVRLRDLLPDLVLETS